MSVDGLKKPVLILTCGLMGSGKSTLAAAIADALGLALIRSDEVRKELAGLKATEHRYELFGEGIYSDDFFDRTYDTLFERASRSLKKQRSVIIDASFKKRKYRARGRILAQRLGVPFLLIETVCSEGEIKKRLRERVRNKKDISDGRREIYKKQKTDFERVTELSSKEHAVLDTNRDLKVNLNKIIETVEDLSA